MLINVQIFLLIDTDFTVFGFMNAPFCPCDKTRNGVTSLWIAFHIINLCLNLFWTYRTETKSHFYNAKERKQEAHSAHFRTATNINHYSLTFVQYRWVLV